MMETDDRINVHDKTNGELKKRFKRACLDNNTSMVDVVNELVGKWVEENEIK